MNLKKITRHPIYSGITANIIFVLLQTVFTILLATCLNPRFLKTLTSFWTLKVDLWIVISISFLVTLFYRFFLAKFRFRIFPYNRKEIEVDKEMYKKLRNELLPEQSVLWLKDCDFRRSFNPSHLDVFDMVGYWHDNPDYEFFIPEIEILKKGITSDIVLFSNLVALNTIPDGVDRQNIPINWQRNNPEKTNEIIQNIHQKRDSICENYDKLIRKSRKILKV